ncbi:MAG: hypothetical protein AABX48_01055 [Nanoarchaeota archaeon]
MDEFWLSENYRKAMKGDFKRKIQFKKLPVNKYEGLIEEIGKEIKYGSKKVVDYSKEPKHIKFFKIVVVLLAVFLFLFLIYSNFISTQKFNYFYDVGSQKDVNSPYLSPSYRVSDADVNGSYRNLTSQLVYFSVPIPRGAKTITIETRFKPSNLSDSLLLGAKDKDVWHYIYQKIYSPELNNLNSLPSIGNVYKTNSSLPNLTSEELLFSPGYVIATDVVNRIPLDINDFTPSETTISTTLRGGNKFYVYLDDSLELSFKKQDLNWYNGTDELNVNLYDYDENIIKNFSIPDDGISSVDHSPARIQAGSFSVGDLYPGVYIIEFQDFDGLIRSFTINTNKIVSDKLFLADNSLYSETKPTSLYINSTRPSQVSLRTYHSQGKQVINYNNNKFNFDKIQTPVLIDLSEGDYTFTFPENDIIVSYPGYIAFSKENYFQPFTNTFIPLSSDFNYILYNADYILTSYIPPKKDSDWFISEKTFSIKDDGLYVNNNGLSMIFNSPSISEGLNSTISVDWINITIDKPGIFGGQNEAAN